MATAPLWSPHGLPALFGRPPRRGKPLTTPAAQHGPRGDIPAPPWSPHGLPAPFGRPRVGGKPPYNPSGPTRAAQGIPLHPLGGLWPPWNPSFQTSARRGFSTPSTLPRNVCWRPRCAQLCEWTQRGLISTCASNRMEEIAQVRYATFGEQISYAIAFRAILKAIVERTSASLLSLRSLSLSRVGSIALEPNRPFARMRRKSSTSLKVPNAIVKAERDAPGMVHAKRFVLVT